MNVPAAEQERKQRDFSRFMAIRSASTAATEDQVLVATDAQETRDLIRILANLFKSRGMRPRS